MTGQMHLAHSQARLMFRRKSMFTPGFGGSKKPAEAGIPDELLPFVSPPPAKPEQPAQETIPNDIVALVPPARRPMKPNTSLQQPLRSTAPHTDRKTRRHQAMVDRGPLLQDSLSLQFLHRPRTVQKILQKKNRGGLTHMLPSHETICSQKRRPILARLIWSTAGRASSGCANCGWNTTASWSGNVATSLRSRTALSYF